MPRCSIIIPVHNRASLTGQCLNAILGHPPESAYEIIVVDDASTDTTGSVLTAYGDRVRVVVHATNTGFAVSCNDGAATASGEFLVFLNNDTIPRTGWLDALLRYADAHPEAAVVGAKLLFPNDTVQHAGVVICQDRYPRHIYAGFPEDHPAVNKSRRFQIVTAACALVRRGTFEQLEGFDTSFVNGYEDVDFCLRLGERGHEVHYCHESVLYHFESVSERRFEHLEHNNQLYRSRWAPRVKPDDVQYYLEDGLLNVSYAEHYPIRLEISPVLAVVAGHEREQHVDALLDARARQVFGLLKENIDLTVRLRETEHSVSSHLATNGTPSTVVSTPPTVSPIPEPRMLFRGKVYSPSKGSMGRLISIIMPTKNGATQLREHLPRILNQRVGDRIEIVAVDSGSHDDTIDVLRKFHATVVAIDPRSYNHGLVRNLGASYAKGHVLVFVNQSTMPADDQWLASLVEPLFSDPLVAGVCSRVMPRDDADLLNRKDGLGDPSASSMRSVRSITNRAEYGGLPHHQLRLLINFHTVSAAIRPQVLTRIPFRKVRTIGEDILWAKEVLEAGFKIQHEPSSVVLHSHNYSYFDILQRNVDDGIANREIVGRQLSDDEVVPLIFSMVRSDWQYLEQHQRLDPAELEQWRFASVLRRSSQVVGQWVGVNQDRLTGDLVSVLSLTERIKAGANGRSAEAKVT